jgi:hypothetical protein
METDSAIGDRRLRRLTLVAGVSLIVSFFLAFGGSARAAEPDWIRVSGDGRSFVTGRDSRTFAPWGFNYDHDERGRLLEDYWVGEWMKVEEDFREMKELGANVVRIHLQLGKFMPAADKPDEKALSQLARLVRLAEKVGLYLDLTGLGCYHKKDVPAWYDRLEEAERWNVQARFWEAVAAQCAKSPAVFCYDLMNEPVVPGGPKRRDDRLGPPFGDKHFVQFIALETNGRARPDVAVQWIRRLVSAIRKHDRRHLITVGLVDWSLDRPGLTSGFVPKQVAPELDFLALHIYPEKGKLADALATLRGFAVGKPVVVEEVFPLKCSAGELRKFMDDAKPLASGWIGFYWGKTAEECRKSGTIHDALMLNWLELFQSKAAELKERR